MIVAQIAFNQLTTKAKAEVQRLIQIQIQPLTVHVLHDGDVDVFSRTSTFVTAACWADDVKNNSNRECHFFDIPFSPDGTIPELKTPNCDILEAIDRFAKQLKDNHTSDADKARALRFLIHYYGDIHQPLHCVTRCTNDHPEGDRGGNEFHVVGHDNLHSYWDGGIDQFPKFERPLSSSDAMAVQNMANGITTEFTRNKLAQALTVEQPDAWSKESFNLATNVAYNLTQTAKPSNTYNSKSKKVVRERVALAGYRLADFLNGVFN
jgi:hypothetical protein